jgi:chemotaxis protein MotB
MKNLGIFLVLATLGALTTGCNFAVSREAYDKDLAAMRGQQDAIEAQKAALDKQLQACEARYTAKNSELSTCIREKMACQDSYKTCDQKLEKMSKIGGNCSRDLAQCQIDTDALKRAKMELTAARDALQKENARLKADGDKQGADLKIVQDRLMKIESNIAAVRTKLQKLVDSGALKVNVRNGFLVIELQSDILFDTGKSELKPEAKQPLADLAVALQGLSDRRFQVAGHTDPTGSDALNWRLSVARAVAVVETLVADGVPAKNLSAGGYGPHMPVASNDTDEGKKRNRRVELLLLPDLGELLNLAK